MSSSFWFVFIAQMDPDGDVQIAEDCCAEEKTSNSKSFMDSLPLDAVLFQQGAEAVSFISFFQLWFSLPLLLLLVSV